MNNMQPLDLSLIPFPETADWQEAMRTAIGTNYQNLPMNFALANQVNRFNTNQALRGYSMLQPYFRQNQELIGRNVASFAKGELPSDVVSSIGRAAASRGFSQGIGMGSRGGGYNTALGALNLRNLGLTSLQLSQAGTGMAMDANSRAAAMTPSLFSPSQMFMSPEGAFNAELANAGIINRWNEANTGILNQQAGANTQMNNQMSYEIAQLNAANRMAQAQAVQSAASTVGGLAGRGYFGGMQPGGVAGQGQYSSANINALLGGGMAGGAGQQGSIIG